jgi:acetyl esterase/lipase
MPSAKAKRVSASSRFDPPPATAAAKLGRRTATVKAWIEAQPGAEGHAFTPRKNSPPLVVIYKIMGRMFAILSVLGVEDVILAQAIRRAGWNVLTLHYRGSWGSPGVFSIAHVLEDADAAVAFVRRPDVAGKFGIDTRRIVVGGHSMGGFAAAAHARRDPNLAGVVLIDAWNVGADADEFSKIPKDSLASAASKAFDDLGNSLQGATALGVAQEIIAHRAEWNYLPWAPQLAHVSLLVIGASRGIGGENAKLAAAVVDWLQKLESGH